jgi:hypothetical protein
MLKLRPFQQRVKLFEIQAANFIFWYVEIETSNRPNLKQRYWLSVVVSSIVGKGSSFPAFAASIFARILSARSFDRERKNAS